MKQAMNPPLTQPGADEALQREMRAREMRRKQFQFFPVSEERGEDATDSSGPSSMGCRNISYRTKMDLVTGEERIQSLLHDILRRIKIIPAIESDLPYS